MWKVMLWFLMVVSLFANKQLHANPNLDIYGTVVLDQFSLLKPKSYNNQTSGGNLRTANLFLNAKIQDQIKLKWDIGFDDTGKASIGVLFLNFEHMHQTHIMVGQIPSPFCLENANSFKWTPILERSLAATAFKPCIGPGAGIKHWQQNTFLHLAIRQPPYGWAKKQKATYPEGVNDNWGGSIRMVWAPLHDHDNVVHMGDLTPCKMFLRALVLRPHPR